MFITLHKERDVESVAALAKKCGDYFLMLDGYEPDESGIVALFADVPPGRPLENLKIWGWKEGPTLIGAIWCYHGYPEEKDAYIGLLLVAADRRKNGIGKKLYEYAETALRSNAYQKIQLAIIAENTGALQFWPRMGFVPFKTHPERQLGDKMHVLLEFSKGL